MNFLFRDKRISGLLTVVPARERLFVDEMRQFNFPEHRSLKLKEVMGYDRHRVVDDGVCVSDLVVFAFEYLFRQGWAAPDSFDALLLVTQTPDYLLPPTSNVVHGRLQLPHDMLCLDINQGCAGFVVGLIQAFALLEQPGVRRVALVNADVLSRRVSPHDRNSWPLAGDAASIAFVERSAEPRTIHANLKTDGGRHQALRVPAGGMRLPCSAATAVFETDAEGNRRAPDHLVMNGTDVFNFVQMDVPPLIQELLATAGATLESVDSFLFHQPNRFMLQKLADKLGIPHEKMPSNVVERHGNSSGVTIPVAIADNLAERLKTGSILACLAGFGVGLTWASLLMPLGPLDFCRLIPFEGNAP